MIHNHPNTISNPFIVISTIEGHYRIPLADIIYLTAHNSSTQLHIIGNRRLVSANSITHYENTLAPFGFLRIHQSTLINTQHLYAICKKDDTNTALLTTGEKLIIARAKKTEAVKALKALSIESHSPSLLEKGLGDEVQPNNPTEEPINGKYIPNSHKSSTPDST